MDRLLFRILAFFAPLSVVWLLSMSALAQTPGDTVQASAMRFGYGAAGPPISCPGSDVWLLAYWMGQPPNGVPVLSAHQMCPNVDRFWVSINGRWFGYSPLLPNLANDPFDPPVGSAVFLHGERVTSTPVAGDAGASTGGVAIATATSTAITGADTGRPTSGATSISGLTEYALSLTRLLPAASDALETIGELARDAELSDEAWRLDVRNANVALRDALTPLQGLDAPPCLETSHLLLAQTVESQIGYSLLLDSALDTYELGNPDLALDPLTRALAGLQGGNALLIRAVDTLRSAQCAGETPANGQASQPAATATATVAPTRTVTPTPVPTITAVRPDASGCPASHPVKAVRQTGLYHQPGSTTYATVAADFCFVTASDAQAAGYRAAAGLAATPVGSSCPQGYVYKGTRNSAGELVFYAPGQQAYNSIQPLACFASTEDAVAAGYRLAL
jgi:hypothetical protein